MKTSGAFKAQLCRAVAVLMAAVLVATIHAVIPAEPASAVPSGETPEEAPPLCEVTDLTLSTTMPGAGGFGYGSIWVPAGASVTFDVSGETLPSRYWGNGRGEYQYFVRIFDGEQKLYDDWSAAGLGVIWHGGPYEWVPFSLRRIGTWTNNTGQDKSFLIETEARRSYAGAATEWHIHISGVDPSDNPACQPAEPERRDLLGHPPYNEEVSDPVNVATGNLVDTWNDLVLPAAAGPIEWSRTFNSLDLQDDGLLGSGWSTSLESRIESQADGALFIDADGREVLFPADGAGYGDPVGLRAELSGSSTAGWQLAWSDGAVSEFDTEGRLSRLVSPHGVAADVGRDASGRPDQVVADTGYSLTFGYLPSGLLETVSASDGRVVTYRYEDGFLAGVADPEGDEETYQVDGAGRITQVNDPEGRLVISTEYDSSGRAIRQHTPDGETVEFAYDTPNVGSTTVTWVATGDTATFVTDDRGRLTEVIDALGASTIRGYDGDNLASVVDRRDGLTFFTWDERGNLLKILGPGVSALEYTWDDLNRLIGVRDGSGRLVEMTYEGSSRVPATVSPEGQGTWTVESDAGLIELITDPDGVETVYGWDTARNLVSVSDGLGNTTDLTYHPAGWLIGLESPLGHTQAWTHDAVGRVLSEQSADDAVRRWTYDGAGNVLTVSNPAAPSDVDPPVLSYQYDDAGRLTSIIDQAGETWSFEWNEAGDMVRHIAPGNAVTQYVYGPLRRLTREISPEGIETHYEYDAEGNLTATTIGPDPADPARRWTNLIDEDGRVTDQLGPEGAVGADGAPVREQSRTVYDAAGRITELVSGSGDDAERVWYQYDPAGRLHRQIVDLSGAADVNAHTNAVTEYSYTPAGRLASMIEPSTGVQSFDWDGGDQTAKRVTNYSYDDAGRLSSVVDPASREWTITYDDDGRPIREDGPGGLTTRWDLDPVGRIIAEYTPSPTGVGESVEEWLYDPAGRVIKHADLHDPINPSMVAQSTFGYHPRGELAFARNPRQSDDTTYDEVSYEYDGRGNLITQSSWWSADPSDPAVEYQQLHEQWEWDLDDRMVAHVRPGGGRTEYGYDDATGWLSSVAHPSGRSESFTRWPNGLVRDHTFSMPDAADLVVSRWYDNRGRQTRLVDPLGETSYGWDRVGNLASVAEPNGTSVAYQHDVNGLLTTLTSAWGYDLNYSYDKLGRPVELSQGTTPRASWEYDALGRLVREELGTDAAGGWAEWTYPGNGAGNPTSFTQHLASNPERAFSFTWDHAGRLAGQASPAGSESFAYDLAGQLIERTKNDESWQWTYDNRGLITEQAKATAAGTETTYTSFDIDGRPLSGAAHLPNGWVFPTSYDHDADGRMTQARLGSLVMFDAAYDARGLPSSIGNWHAGGLQTSTRDYDGDGYLVGVEQGAGEIPVVWDRSVADGGVLGTHSWGARNGLIGYTWGPAGAVGVNYGASWLGGVHRDLHGSSHNTVGLEGFSPWGEPEGAVPGSIGIGYRGELTIDGIVHLRNRDYQPGLRRFTTPDPLGGVPATPTAANRYHYADNDPLNKIDPLGLQPYDDDLIEFLQDPIPEISDNASPIIDTVLEVSGVNDIRRCADGSVGSCMWVIVSILPGVKAGRAIKGADRIDDISDARHIDDVIRNRPHAPNPRTHRPSPGHRPSPRGSVDKPPSRRIDWGSDRGAVELPGGRNPRRGGGADGPPPRGGGAVDDPNVPRRGSDTPQPNWNPRSRPTFGHTFETHGAGLKNTTRLRGRAGGTGQPQGQWLDNDGASKLLRELSDTGTGPRSVPIPDGMAQVILPDGSIVPATHATLIPNGSGGYTTAYPTIGGPWRPL